MYSTEIKYLWSKFMEQQYVYVIVLGHLMPYIENPDYIPREQYLLEDQKESLVLCFLTEESAKIFQTVITEMYDSIKPSELSIEKFGMDEIFKYYEILNQVSQQNYKCPVRVDLAEYVTRGDDPIDATWIQDTLISSYILKN